MYHALLTNRYLSTRAIPFIAVAAVALCVALVIVVVSVMTGFLDMVKSSGRTLIGDVVISHAVTGIPYYPELIDRIEALPEATAATPVVNSWGLLKMPYPQGRDKSVQTVQIWGIEPESFSAVTGFADTLYWRPVDPDKRDTLRDDDFRIRNEGRINFEQQLANGAALRDLQADKPGIVLGMHVSEGNDRRSDGTYEPMNGGFWWMPAFNVTLTTIPMDDHGGLGDPESVIFPVVNEFISGVFIIDDTRVMVPLETAQQMMGLEEAEIVDENDFEKVIGTDPARATMILVRAAEGVDAESLLAVVAAAYDDFYAEKDAQWDRGEIYSRPRMRRVPGGSEVVTVETWEQQQRAFIGPVEKERELMRTLFSIVYLVCAALVLAIFWAIVYEKTRDIGILRSIGASRLGITWIFLRYGLLVGVIGSIAGFGLGLLIVSNINAIHDGLAEPPIVVAVILGICAVGALVATILRSAGGALLPLVLGSLITLTLAALCGAIVLLDQSGGIVIWDPSVYYFTEIPNTVDPGAVAITMVGAVLFSVLGAFIPAAKAADTDPVKALRYE